MKLRRVVQCASAAVAVLAMTGAVPAQAQVTRVESGTMPSGSTSASSRSRAIDSRVDDDVLVAGSVAGRVLARLRRRRTSTAPRSAANGSSASASTSRRASAPASTRSTVHSVYDQKVRDDGREIEQDLKLRIVPLSATVRFLPIGRGGVEPYVGAGIGAFNWHYSEVGEFIDTERRHRHRPVRGRRHGRPARWCSAASASRWPTCGRSAARCAGRRPRARGCSTERVLPRRQDRSRRLDHELHGPSQVLTSSNPKLQLPSPSTPTPKSQRSNANWVGLGLRSSSGSLGSWVGSLGFDVALDRARYRAQPRLPRPPARTHPGSAGRAVAAWNSTSPPSARSSITTQLHESARPSRRRVHPQLLVAFLQEVADVQAAAP